jgi:hypothetical protein
MYAGILLAYKCYLDFFFLFLFSVTLETLTLLILFLSNACMHILSMVYGKDLYCLEPLTL